MMELNKPLSRREMLRRSAVFALATQCAPLLAASESRRFRIGACDWSINKMGDSTSFELARQMGLDGVQVSLSVADNNLKMLQPEVQQEFKSAAKAAGVEVCSFAMIELVNTPFKSDPRTVNWVRDAVGIAKIFGVRVVQIPFFAKNDIKGDKAGIDEVVSRLKEVAPEAEKAGKIFGLESRLSAAQLMDIMDRVGSPAVQVYYDVWNTWNEGYDLYQEIRTLGNKRICEFHAKEEGKLLGQGKVDFHKVRQAMDDIEYRGWVQIESSVPKGGPILESYQANCKFLRNILS